MWVFFRFIKDGSCYMMIGKQKIVFILKSFHFYLFDNPFLANNWVAKSHGFTPSQTQAIKVIEGVNFEVNLFAKSIQINGASIYTNQLTKDLKMHFKVNHKIICAHWTCRISHEYKPTKRRWGNLFVVVLDCFFSLFWYRKLG